MFVNAAKPTGEELDMDFLKRFLGEKDELAPTGDANVELRHLTGEEFDEMVLTSEMPAVIDFWAEWCGPCHMISPAVQQLANEYSGPCRR